MREVGKQTEMLLMEFPAKVVLVQWVCGLNGCDGFMKSKQAGTTFLSSGTDHYEHTCDKCGRRGWATKMYPCYEFQKVGTEKGRLPK